jgi:sugar/nucleoside kinase (ribokinase family)
MYTPLERRLELTPQPADWQPQDRIAAVHLATMPPHAQGAWIRDLRERAAWISLDTDVSFIHKDRSGLVQALEATDIFFPNEEEAHALFPDLSLERVAQRVAALGPQIVVIKRGRKGALLYSKEQEAYYHIPALPVEVVDVTGAGDAFAGGCVAGLVATGDLEEAGWRGAVAASLAIQGYGGLHVLEYSPQAVHKRLQDFKEGETR